ncbi:MAG: 5-(carboxyamino)imidazole ribonucleotide synthase [Halioglobus sp.]
MGQSDEWVDELAAKRMERAGCRVGIIGGGQLGMYLCEAARPLGLTTTVLMSRPDESAAHAADAVIIAALDDLQAVRALIETSDVITFELEAIPEATIEMLEEAEAQSQLRVFPRLKTLRLLKDKGLQKTWLHEQSLPTLPFVVVPEIQELSLGVIKPVGLPLVQKACQGGYDGKGVQMLRSEKELQKAWPVSSVLEPLLDHRVEVSVIVARDCDGDLVSYPPVSMDFDERFNAVSSVMSPASIPEQLQQECETLARRAVNALEGIGVFAIELFIAQDGSIYINEISPRVHNSGHLTMEAFTVSQFEQHIRAVVGLPLMPVVKQREFAVMLNILYDDSWSDLCPAEPCRDPVKLSLMSQAHWYGKPEGTVGRKMGHLTTLGNSAAATGSEASRALMSLRATDLSRPVTSTYFKEPVCH